MKKLMAICSLVVLFSMSYARAGTWTTIPDYDYPGVVNTLVCGISGNNIVGYGGDTESRQYGFLYNMTTKSVTNLPISGFGIDGSNIVGGTNQVYNITTQSLTTLNMPGAQSIGILGISGNNLVGYYGHYETSETTNGFLYNGTSWTTLDYPGAGVTHINGIDGSNLVGYYGSSGIQHGFLYDGAHWTTLDYPGASDTSICGISGSNLVGYYTDASGNWNGCLYDGTWTTLDYPEASHTYIGGISGNNLVGSYYNGYPTGNEYWHGFVYTVPEPATLLLLGLGAVMLRRKC